MATSYPADFKVKNGLVVNTTASFLSTITSTSTTTGGVIVSGGIGVVKDIWVGGTINVRSTTSATNTTSGALQVVGGVGIQGDLYARNLYSNGILIGTNAGSASTATNLAGGSQYQIPYQAASSSTVFILPPPTTQNSLLQFTVGSGFTWTNTTTVGGGTFFYSPIVDTFTSAGTTTTYTLSTSPANKNILTVVVDGVTQLQSAFNLSGNSLIFSEIPYNGANIDVHYANVLSTTTIPAAGTIGQIQYNWNGVTSGTTLMSYNSSTGAVSITSTTAATSTQTGALTVTGGVGIGGNLYVGGDIVANKLTIQLTTVTTTLVTTDDIISTYNTTPTNSTNTGALQIGGGAGIAGGLYVAGITTVTNALNASTMNVTSAGSVSQPAFTFGATNQGIYNPSGGDLGFVASGYLQLYIAGTNPAVNYLQVAGGGTGAPVVLTATGTDSIVNLTLSPKNNGAVVVSSTSATNSTITGALQVVGGLGVGGGAFFGGIVTATNFSGSLSGGTAMSIHYQSAANTTAFLAAGSAGQILQTNGTGSAPTWVSVTGLTAGNATTATNIAGGTAGQLHYQSAPGITAFAGPGTAGQILVSAGTSAPTYTNTGSIYVNRATLSDTSTNAATAYSTIGSHSAGTGLTGSAFNGSANQTWSLNTATLMASAVSAINLSAGSAMALPYQSASGTTAYLAAGTSGQILQTNSTGSAPTWVAATGLTAGNATTATNIAAGTAGQLHYQSAPGITAFAGPGSFGQFLMSTGAGAPVYQGTLTQSGGNILVNGSLGIGTASPTSLISLAGGTASTLGLTITPAGWNNARHRFTVPTSGDTSVWSFNYTGSAVDTSSYATSSISVGQANIAFSAGATNTAPSTIATINTTGLGVGTTSPVSIFHVRNGSLFPQGRRGGSASAFFFENATVSDLYLELANTVTNYSGVLFSRAATGNYGLINYNNATDNMVFYTAGAVQHTITSAGGFAFGSSQTAYGSSGQILQSNGNAPPTWVAPSGLSAGSVANALTMNNSGSGAASGTTFNGSAAQTISYNTIGASAAGTLNDASSTRQHNGFISADTRSTNYAPGDRSAGFYADFKTNTTDSLVDGGTYHGVLTFRPYGNSLTDFTGGNAQQIATTDNNNLWHRMSSSSSTWGTWQKIIDTGNTGTAYVNRAVIADSAAGSSAQVNTTAQTANANYFLTFVDTNNASAAAETVYTTSTFSINPATGFVNHSTGGIVVGDTTNAIALQSDYSSPLIVQRSSNSGKGAIIMRGSDTIGTAIEHGRSNVASHWGTYQAFLVHDDNVSDALLSVKEKMRINATGVGIGTTSPNGKLTVSSAGAEGIEFFPASSAGVNTTQHYNRSGATYVRNRTIASDYTFNLSGAGSDAMMLDSSGNLLLTGGTTQLNTGFTNKLNVSGSIVAGASGSTNGTLLLQGNYGTGSITNIGTEYSSGGPVVGYGVYPSNAAAGAFFSSSGNALTRGAYTIAGNQHNWYVGASQTVTIGSAATLSLAMSVSSGGINLPTPASGNANISFDGSTFTLVSNSSSAGLVLSTNSTERLRITSSGGFAFGGASNYGSSGQVLQSNGNAAPTWVNQSAIAAGSAPLTNTYVGFGSASNLLTGSSNLTYASSILNLNYQAAFNATTPGFAQYGIHLNGQTTNDYATGITFSAGSASAGNANAGIYSQGSGSYGTKMYFATTDSYAVGSKTRVMINESGNVGIGTISPGLRLDVSGAANFTSGVQVGSTSGLSFGASKWMVQGESTILTRSYACGPDTSTYGSWEHYTARSNGTPISLMRWDANGNVGIGTSSPPNKLTISNNGSVGLEITPTGGYTGLGGVDLLAYNRGSAVYAPIGFVTNSSNNSMVILTNGNVGIATTTPGEKLTVNGSFSSVGYTNIGGTTYISGTNNNTLNSGYSTAADGDDLWINYRGYLDGQSYFRNFNIGNGKGGNILWASGPTGNVGIGTGQTASYRLDFAPLNSTSDTFNIRFGINNGPGTGGSGYGATAGGGTSLGTGIVWVPNYTGYTKRSAGILQIGEGNYFRSGLAFYTNNIQDQTTDWTEAMRIGSNGNVSIGQGSAPALLNKFDVYGTNGQLFSVSDSFSGTIFAASDVSGVPSIEVLDTGLVKFAQYNGSVAISTGTAVAGSALSVYGIVSTIGSASEIRGAGEITAYYSSDERLKENISVISNPIEIISQIRGVFYDWTDEQLARRGGEDGYFVRKHDIGVIAQEVEKVLPEIVATRDDGYKAVRYEKLVPLLIESIKSQQAEIDTLKYEMNEMRKLFQSLKGE